ncbi:chemotaxis-specific methylesterase [Rhodospirillum rubrum F11]|uniref:Protein-glutamate methylesterase/protein-glutamine glutaminase 1 n=3 Tax=Rhodospirillum rubrum TaxID=1085 RepID=CHEB1_RHORT|nr:chemotaxis response regulator protein-glutamate methylesterase [Rhodospirillum rubrum]Q2RX18.1 RecName: Full=Protein-glutamate methylesterase/protein-glutamine glutaminase 1 [Rhodospirillum rubrum ATCC 11170]ABC21327.1 Two component CheB methylesterase [Rhodospirillum rubrum ATCC 11170]AEO47007.1 chemotaxis-specific methylesterase [Rhodospirillum rubrum F11]MBK5952914.1 chemotaxis response regulator protein-glutamate methylesterase [Rhodospirillum rubrum]QXG81008.1 chemotaxis response regul
MTITTSEATSHTLGGPIRVMVVDDSAVVRGLETRMLEEDPAIQVVASVGNGQMAVQALDRHDIEVVILDIEMPVMDGLTALPELLRKSPNLKVIMASTLTLRNAEVTLKALQMGASECLAKPTTSREISGGTDFRHDLVEKVKALGGARRRALGRAAPTARAGGAVVERKVGALPSLMAQRAQQPISLRPAAEERPDIIAIGSSTGGPQALFTVFGDMRKGGWPSQPIVVTQHMPATFTTILAGHIERVAGVPTAEAKDGDPIRGGHIYIAPGDYHMVVETRGTEKILRLNQDPPESFCRPAVDPLFRSVAKAYGRRVLAVVLTGMGADGSKGGKIIAESGGTVIAQDEPSSVVWGMPGATAQIGACSAVLPLKDIAAYVLRSANKR